MANEKAKELVILVVGLAGGHLTTETRFQKIAFLVNEVLNFGVKFEPKIFGPYSKELENATDKLSRDKVIKYEIDSDGVVHYSLTERGREEFEKLKESFKDLEKAKKVVEEFKDAPLDYILAYVYSKYPQYAVKSTVTDKVEEWRKYYGF